MNMQGSHYDRAVKIHGETLKDILKEKHITQKQLADAIGVHINTINNCVRLGRIERFEKFVALCDYLHICPNDISNDENAIDYFVLQECKDILTIALDLLDAGFDLDKNSTRSFLEAIYERLNHVDCKSCHKN